MFAIGTFARLGQVTLRTLRYYDEEGLLQPATIDDRTGYRWYRADQLHRLNRIIALRDLGLSLAEVRQVLDEELSPAELRGMLRLRQIEARQRVAAESVRLARAEARLRRIESEGRLGGYDVVVKSLEATHLAVLSENVAAFGNETLGPVFSRLYPRLHESLARAGIHPLGPALAMYAESGDEYAPIRVAAGLPVASLPEPPVGVEVHELAMVPRAATTIHRGPMSRVGEGYDALVNWVEDNDEQVDGFGRELSLDCTGEPDTWVTELQFPLVGTAAPEERP